MEVTPERGNDQILHCSLGNQLVYQCGAGVRILAKSFSKSLLLQATDPKHLDFNRVGENAGCLILAEGND